MAFRGVRRAGGEICSRLRPCSACVALQGGMPAVFGMLCLLAFGAAFAQDETLYEAEVEVAEGPQGQSEAIRAALAQVLVKLTGDPNAPVQPELTEMLQAAPQYVQQYRYLDAQAAEGEPQGQPAAQSSSPRRLWVRFEPSALKRLLRRRPSQSAAQAPPPSLLVWLAVDEAGSRRLLGAEESYQVRATLDELSRERGVPVFLPVLDLEDQGRIAVGDVWDASEQRIRGASERYGPQAILAGRAQLDEAGQWRVLWTLYPPRGGDVSLWESVARERDRAISDGLVQAVDSIMGRSASSAPMLGSGSLSLHVTDLTSYPDYVKALRYLQSLKPVQQVLPTWVRGREAAFEVRFQGSEESVREAIVLGRTLEPLPRAVERPAPSAPVTGSEPQSSYRLSR